MNIFVLDASPLRAAEMPSTATGSTTGVRKLVCALVAWTRCATLVGLDRALGVAM